MTRPLVHAALVALVVVAIGSLPAGAQSRSSEGVRHEVSGELWDDRLGDDPIMSGRTTIAPGAAMLPTRFAPLS